MPRRSSRAPATIDLPPDGDAPKPAAPAASDGRLPLHAAPKRRKAVPEPVQKPQQCTMVYVLVDTGTKLDALPLHEVPLLRRKLHMQDPSGTMPKVLAEWQATAERMRALDIDGLRAEHRRLVERYTVEKPGSQNGEEVNLVPDVYGNGLHGLRDSMRRLHAGFQQIVGELADGDEISDEQIEELVALSDPDFDLTVGGGGERVYREFEPAGAGDVVASA